MLYVFTKIVGYSIVVRSGQFTIFFGNDRLHFLKKFIHKYIISLHFGYRFYYQLVFSLMLKPQKHFTL